MVFVILFFSDIFHHNGIGDTSTNIFLYLFGRNNDEYNENSIDDHHCCNDGYGEDKEYEADDDDDDYY